MTYARLWLCPLLALWASVLAGCTLPADPALPPTPTSALSPTDTPPGAWRTVAGGLELRSYPVSDQPFGSLLIARIDPQSAVFRVHYRPGEPLTLTQWRAQLPDAALIVNANFFDPEHRALGLLVADGVAHGVSYVQRGGTFAVEFGAPRIAPHDGAPFSPQGVEQAVQGFPVLVRDRTAAYTVTAGDRVTRRTVIALDDAGRVLVIVTPGLGIRLAELAAALAESDLAIVSALNLDGGGSTLLGVDDITLISRDAVPAVLAVYPR